MAPTTCDAPNGGRVPTGLGGAVVDGGPGGGQVLGWQVRAQRRHPPVGELADGAEEARPAGANPDRHVVDGARPGLIAAVPLKRPSMHDRPAGSSAARTIRMPAMVACRLSRRADGPAHGDDPVSETAGSDGHLHPAAGEHERMAQRVARLASRR